MLGNGNPKVIIDANGNVGIGTTQPRQVFHVANDGNNVVINAFGNVGIGTIQPQVSLDIFGQMRSFDFFQGAFLAPDIHFWLDMSSRSYFTIKGGDVVDTVMTINDKRGFGFPFTSISSKEPVFYENAINGLGAILMNDKGFDSSSTHVMPSNGFHLFAVIKSASTIINTQTNSLVSYADGTYDNAVLISLAEGASTTTQRIWVDVNYNEYTNLPSLFDTQSHIFEIEIDPTSQLIKGWRDNIQIYSSTLATLRPFRANSGRFCFGQEQDTATGGGYDNTQSLIHTYLGEIIMYNGIMTEINRSTIFNYLYNKWYQKQLRSGIVAIGGSPSDVGGYRIHTFLSSSTFTVTTSGVIEALVVAGGGGGAATYGGGGGAGGLLYVSSFFIQAGIYSVTIGGGGAVRTNGQNSSIGSLLIAVGGGRAGNYSSANDALSGGSGGGVGSQAPSPYGAFTQGTYGTRGQGNSGGFGYHHPGYDAAGGGGGGAGFKGANVVLSGNVTPGGAGGNGLRYTVSGTSTYYAGGGGGTGGTVAGGGGLGGGGAGAASSTAAGNGTANTGGGGGGSHTGTTGSGGSGIVIIRYAL